MSRERAATVAPAPERPLIRAGVLAFLPVLLVTFAARGPFTAIGPLIPELQADFGISNTAAAALAAAPILCFGLLAPFVPRLTEWFSLHRAVFIGVAAIGAGVLLRAVTLPGLFAGSLLIGAGIIVVNVLVPAVTKVDFPGRIPLVTGITTTAYTVSASVGAGLALPLAALTGSANGSLLLWGLPVFAALLAWAPAARRARRPPPPQARPALLALLRDRVALAVTLFFSMQTVAFYTLMTWLPSILHRDAGLSLPSAGALVAIAAALGGPASFLVPWLAGRTRSQVGWVVVVTVPMAVGLIGLAVAPAAAPVFWTIAWGVGNGAAFPLGLILVLLRTRDGTQTARLSATSQCLGYLLAATGPLAAGGLFDLTASWTPALAVLIALLVPQVIAGWAAARPRFVAAP